MSLTRYTELLALQRENHPRYSKYHFSLPIINFTKTALETAEELLTFPSAYYVNTIEVGNPLYTDVEDFFYYEFIVTSLVTSGTLSDWLYFYIPVSYNDPTFQIGGSPFIDQITLPYYKYYDSSIGLAERVYPHKPFMFSLPRPNIYTFAEPLRSQRHPFGNHFLFTGNFYLKSNINKYVYEYVDYQQVSEYGYVILFSDIPPLDFYPLANRINNNSFREERSNDVQLPPGRLAWTGNMPDLRFTGRITNETFAGNQPWFEYRSYTNDQPIDRVILPDPPTYLPLDYVKVFFGEDMGINIPTHSSTQQIKYRQISTNQKLLLHP